jgi:uncharacterized protein YqeY
VSLKDKINEDLKTAMKAKDKERTSVLRMILSEIKYAQAAVNAHAELPEDEAMKVVMAYHKRLAKSVDDFPEGERRDAIRSEIGIVEEYLPKRASAADVDRAIGDALAATTERNFGVLMKDVMVRLGAGADGKVVSQALKARLGN